MAPTEAAALVFPFLWVKKFLSKLDFLITHVIEKIIRPVSEGKTDSISAGPIGADLSVYLLQLCGKFPPLSNHPTGTIWFTREYAILRSAVALRWRTDWRTGFYGDSKPLCDWLPGATRPNEAYLRFCFTLVSTHVHGIRPCFTVTPHPGNQQLCLTIIHTSIIHPGD